MIDIDIDFVLHFNEMQDQKFLTSGEKMDFEQLKRKYRNKEREGVKDLVRFISTCNEGNPNSDPLRGRVHNS